MSGQKWSGPSPAWHPITAVAGNSSKKDTTGHSVFSHFSFVSSSPAGMVAYLRCARDDGPDHSAYRIDMIDAVNIHPSTETVHASSTVYTFHHSSMTESYAVHTCVNSSSRESQCTMGQNADRHLGIYLIV